jgi:class 3 adenylate cyclase/YHS domain-containing protein
MTAEPTADRAVLFADLAGFTALTEAHGDGEAADVADRFGRLASSVLAPGARVVKTIGDAVMIVAPDGRTGLQTALRLLRSVDDEPSFPGVRIGLHVGPVVERGTDLFGATVNLAARLAGHAHVGQLLATEAIVELVVTDDDVTIAALGPTYLKNIGAPVELFSVEDDFRTPQAQVMDPVCRMFVDADDAPARLPWGDRVWLFCSFECAHAFGDEPERYAPPRTPS